MARAIGSASRADRRRHARILGVHQPHDFQRRQRVDLFRSRIAGFGGQAGHAGERVRWVILGRFETHCNSRRHALVM